MPEIVPSLLSSDFSRITDQIEAIERAGATRLHLDIMDGHFVPNITIGPFIVEAIRKVTSLHLESHLMIENPERYIKNFVDAGSDTVIVHVEASKELYADLKMIRKLGVKAGLVLNPPTPFENIEPYLQNIDHLLVMTVNPGFGGQKMIEETLEKVTLAKPYQEKYKFPIEVDGGVNLNTIGKAVKAGADLLVAGEAVFGNNKPEESFIKLSKRVNL
ncbi:MAG: ribulose-phosphate 3-epimerase [Candidatus Marinimicrobia bacterium]|nr:ribulose-phosphate 3-epimerase [Candidatus Neomarinimicrobiota bacterium]